MQLDGLILLVPACLLAFVPLIGFLLTLVLRWLYFALMESSDWQATLGKRALGIKVTDDAGERIDFGRATWRYASAAVSYLILYIGFMLAGWTARKQALHDLIAGTCVVFRDVEAGQAMPTIRPAMPWYGWVLNLFPLIVIPILAAIALPAYQDYLTRAQTAEAAVLAAGAKVGVAEFYRVQSRCPKSNAEAGLADSNLLSGPFISSVAIAVAPNGACTITATFDGPRVSPLLRGRVLTFVANDPRREWRCGGDLPQKYWPRSCGAN